LLPNALEALANDLPDPDVDLVLEVSRIINANTDFHYEKFFSTEALYTDLQVVTDDDTVTLDMLLGDYSDYDPTNYEDDDPDSVTMEVVNASYDEAISEYGLWEASDDALRYLKNDVMPGMSPEHVSELSAEAIGNLQDYHLLEYLIKPQINVLSVASLDMLDNTDFRRFNVEWLEALNDRTKNGIPEQKLTLLDSSQIEVFMEHSIEVGGAGSLDLFMDSYRASAGTVFYRLADTSQLMGKLYLTTPAGTVQLMDGALLSEEKMSLLTYKTDIAEGESSTLPYATFQVIKDGESATHRYNFVVSAATPRISAEESAELYHVDKIVQWLDQTGIATSVLVEDGVIKDTYNKSAEFETASIV
jgi:hypothetical protein